MFGDRAPASFKLAGLRKKILAARIGPMSVRVADKDWGHLYPPFREKLRAVLTEVSRKTGEEWVMSEGLRSPERQLHLFAQGRTRPGKIVTWLRRPLYHGTGLAADCLPARRGYAAPMAWWEALRAAYHRAGLDNPAWGKGDLGHLQYSDPALRVKALAWVRAGCPASSASDSRASSEVRVLFQGHEITDADAYLEEDRVWIKLRPVVDAMDLVIAEVKGRGSARVCVLVDDERDYPIPAVLKSGRCFARAADLPGGCEWNGRAKTLVIHGDAL